MYKHIYVQTATDIDRYMLNKHTHIYIYICVGVCVSMLGVLRVWCLYVCLCVWYRCMRTSVYMYVCMYVCMCGCEDANVCMYSTNACVRTHIHTHMHACTSMCIMYKYHNVNIYICRYIYISM